MGTEKLGDAQDEVCGGRALWQLARHLEANYLWSQHVVGLVQHHGLGFDAPDPPPEDSKPVDHGRM